ncbi:hypothetical protein PYCCODRAFT_1438681 [Trametes coccinea BRFM310]|uniref:DAGKc domain-containing protein n=1 Tax=Trametes coccinea (strain BRFM310) TaxID=1353009 RepID=A0A1Y2ID71_TRAC3|nr:hypothetical protein PYCCODRAFT_1438681 [Trametes coccinea BRFM310]
MSTASANPAHLALGSGDNASNFTLDADRLLIERAADKKWPRVQVPHRNVLWAALNGARFELSVLAKKKPKGPLSLVHVTGPVSDDADKAAAAAFADALMAAAYPDGLQRQRRLKVFVNPKSGPGKAASLFQKKIQPIFRAAHCDVDVTFTSRGKEAQEIAAALPLDRFDAVAVMSGDGLIHEVFNGFAAHAEPRKAFRIPVTPLPTGSGNALAVNLLGQDEAKDISAAALNAIKGRPMKIDLCSFTQGEKRYISFMSQSMGLIADVDLGTDPLRFMGAQRFILGFIYEVIRHKSCPYKVSIKVAQSDKRKMVQDMHADRARAQAAFPAPAAPSEDQDQQQREGEEEASGLPPLRYKDADTSADGWLTFEGPLMSLFAGKGPFVSPDLMQFPVSLPADGLIDVTLQARTNRLAMLKVLDGAERGNHFWLDSQKYYKAHAYRVEPHVKKGWLSIDGEPYPLQPFAVEVHRELGTVLSMYGCFQLEFDLPPEKEGRS